MSLMKEWSKRDTLIIWWFEIEIATFFAMCVTGILYILLSIFRKPIWHIKVLDEDDKNDFILSNQFTFKNFC